MIDEAQTREFSFQSQNNKKLRVSVAGRSISKPTVSQDEKASERNSTFRRFVSIDSKFYVLWQSNDGKPISGGT